MAAMQAVTAVSGQQALYNADNVAKHFGIVATGGRADRDGTSSCQHPQHLDDMIDYFDPTYVTGRHCVVQHPAANDAAPLPPTRLRRQTTTNDPSWNSAFQRLVGHQHPGVWTLLRCLRKDAAVVSTLIVQESRGMPQSKRLKRVYVDLQARLK